MKKYNLHNGFTLVELIVSIAIFGIMMISVMSIFLFSTQMSTRVELNRIMQENIKNVMEDIAEGVRKNKIMGIQTSLAGNCDIPTGLPLKVEGDIFCTNTSKYAIGKKQVDGTFTPVSNVSTDCGYDPTNPSSVAKQCYFIKIDLAGGDYYPLTNSFVTFEDVQFTVTNQDTKKLTIQLTARPAIRKGLAVNQVRLNIIQIQTTISERLIETN